MELGQIHMIDVTQKKETERQAVAKGKVQMKPATLELIHKEELIPLCHPLHLTHIAIEFHLTEDDSDFVGVEITASAKGVEKTGFEMEALVAVSVSALTVYDMCKAVDESMTIGEIRLVRKSGGKSGLYLAD
jgi:cyclic pyranopterin phosphate synthase